MVLWEIQPWNKPREDCTSGARHHGVVLWNCFCVVVLSVICHGRTMPLLWQTLEHRTASVSAEVVIALLDRSDAR